MNQRERMLVMLVGGLVLIGVAFAGLQQVTERFRVRNARIAAVDSEIKKARLRVRAGQQASEQIIAWEQESLPASREAAGSLYKSWLSDWVERNQLIDPQVKVDTPRSNRDYYTAHAFTVSGRTSLPRLTKMLHEFYTAAQLHRIRGLTIAPVGEKQLDVYMVIDALSLPTAMDRSRIATSDERSAKLGELARYEEPILERNIFGPENNSPKLALRSSYQVERGKPFSLKVEARDPDDVDKLRFDADLEELSGARLRDGELEWTPRELGEYYATIEVIDDGIPSRIDRQEIKLTVVEPPPPPPPTPRPEPPKFDYSAYTQLNAIIVKSGRPTAWLWVRPTDEVLKVGEGESFKIGDLQGVMTEIDLKTATFESDGRRFRLPLRGFVGKAQDIGPAATPVATDSPGEAPATPVADPLGDELLPPLEEFQAEAPPGDAAPDEAPDGAEPTDVEERTVTAQEPTAEEATPEAEAGADEAATDEATPEEAPAADRPAP